MIPDALSFLKPANKLRSRAGLLGKRCCEPPTRLDKVVFFLLLCTIQLGKEFLVLQEVILRVPRMRVGSGDVRTEPAESDTAEGPEGTAVRRLVRQNLIFWGVRSEHRPVLFVKRIWTTRA